MDTVTPDDQDGWVIVNPASGNSAFGINGGNLLRLDTRKIPGLGGGNPGSDTAGSPANPERNDKLVEIIFEAEPVDGSNPGAFKTSQNVYINNWSPVPLERDAEDPCDPANTNLKMLYTVDHELLNDWKLRIESDANDFPMDIVSGQGPRGDAGTEDRMTQKWPACAYEVRLSASVKVTTGRIGGKRGGGEGRFLFYISGSAS